MLSITDMHKAKNLYEQWFMEFPDVKNPSDINTQQKYQFAMQIGWSNLRLMQKARKGNTKTNGYPYPWTMAEYWKPARNSTQPELF